MIDRQQLQEARQGLGRKLAAWRKARHLIQGDLARQVRSSRSTVAMVERGRQVVDRIFWLQCESFLNAQGDLITAYDAYRRLEARHRTEKAEAARRARWASVPHGITGYGDPNAEPVTGVPSGHYSTPDGQLILTASAGRQATDPEAFVDLYPDRCPALESAEVDFEVGGGAVVWEAECLIEARRLAFRQAADDDARLGYLENEVRQAIADNERVTPADLMIRIRPLRGYVDQLMAARQHPPQRARLYTAAAYLSGLLGALALDLGAFGVARAYASESFDLADATQQPDAQAWARATQSLIAFYTGKPHDALAYAQDGLRRAGTSPHRIRLAVNGQARALGRLGDRYGVERAVDKAFALLSDQPAGEQISASLTLGPYCPARTAANAATAHLALGPHANGDVSPYLRTAITAFDAAGLAGPQALSRLDLATVHLYDDDPDQAASLAVEALTLTAAHRFESVHQRTQQFLTAAGSLARLPQLRHVADLLAERAWSSRSIRTPLDLRS